MNVKFYGFDFERDWRMVADKLGIRWVDDTKGILAVADNGVVAGCIMNNWTWNAVQVHFWIDSPMVLRHGFLEEVSHYVYDVAERGLMIGMVPADNEEALKLDRHIGFTELCRIPGGYMYDIDYVMLTLSKEEAAKGKFYIPGKEEAA